MGLNPVLEAAKQYLAAGFHPIPVEPPRPGDPKSGKRPLVDWKRYQTEAPTVADLERWWAETPNANVALPMGRGRFVVDVDGEEGWEALREAGIDIEEAGAPHVSTGKGAHFYFAGEVPDRIGALPKVDVRSAGGYVVAPPSLHYSGRRYEWPGGKMPSMAQLPYAPSALVELLRRPLKPTQAAAGGDWITAAMAGVGEGRRAATCTQLAGYYIGMDLPADVVSSILYGFADRCTPPYEHEEVDKIVESIGRRHVPDEAPVVDEEDQHDAGAALVAFVDKLLEPNIPRRVVPTGLSDLDDALNGGLYPGQVTLFGGIGGVGKSITAQMLALRYAVEGIPTLYATLEMPVTDVMVRLISYFTFMDSRDLLAILRGKRKPEPIEVNRIKGVVPVIRDLPLLIRQQSVQTVAALERTLTRRPDVELLIVDQLQHLAHPDGVSGMHGLEANSRALVALAGKHDIPIVALSQVNRPEGRERGNPLWRPSRYSLRGSEQLYHDAAVVLLFHRMPDTPDELEIQVAKGRMGGQSEHWMKFKYRPEVCRVG